MQRILRSVRNICINSSSSLKQASSEKERQLSPVHQEWACTLRIKNTLAQLFLNPCFSWLQWKQSSTSQTLQGCMFSSFIVNSVYFWIQAQLQRNNYMKLQETPWKVPDKSQLPSSSWPARGRWCTADTAMLLPGNPECNTWNCKRFSLISW